MFFKGSRYEKVQTLWTTDASGRRIAFKATRFIARTEPIEGHWVTSDERLDHIAWQHFRDAERYWRICDANGALWPDDVLEPGTVLGIPTAEG
jgi:hypothetical protein